ncbi:hypothetical protein D3C78_1808930 [compost metagenome]
MSAMRANWGTALNRSLTENDPALYPADVASAWAPAMVPPVARTAITGNARSGIDHSGQALAFKQ